jgi:hypothetical protein
MLGGMLSLAPENRSSLGVEMKRIIVFIGLVPSPKDPDFIFDKFLHESQNVIVIVAWE